jgi:hypothetical protein
VLLCACAMPGTSASAASSAAAPSATAGMRRRRRNNWCSPRPGRALRSATRRTGKLSLRSET